MNSELQYWWASERMNQMHEDAARRALVRSLRKPFSLRVAQALIRLGGRIARRASHEREERLSAALSRAIDGDPKEEVMLSVIARRYGLAVVVVLVTAIGVHAQPDAEWAAVE
jgi:hypothetical protein